MFARLCYAISLCSNNLQNISIFTYINQMFEYVCECYRNNIIIIRSRVEYEHRYQAIRILLSHKRCSRGVTLLDSNRSQI